MISSEWESNFLVQRSVREAAIGYCMFSTKDPEEWKTALQNLGELCVGAWRDDLPEEDRAERGLCLRYAGFFPAVEAGVAYWSTQHVAVTATCGVRVIQALGWSGVSIELAAAARIFW